MKNKNIFATILAAAFMGISTFAGAQEAAVTVPTREAMGFSKIVRNPENAAKGFAGLANTDNIAWASFDNSAAIPFSEEKFDVGLIYQHWAPSGLQSSNFGFGTAGRIGKHFGASLGFIMQKGQEYPLFTDEGIEDGTASPSDLQVNLGLAYKFNNIVSLGANFKYLRSAPSDQYSYNSFLADVMAQCSFYGVSIALGVANVGPSVKDASGISFKVPTSVALGADYQLKLAKVHGLNFDVDFDYYLSGNITTAVGMEYGFNDMVFVRGGYHYGSAKAVIPSFASVGLGLQFFGCKLDFSYLFANKVLGNTMTIGLGYSF